MTLPTLPADHPAAHNKRVGVLLVNLGTPQAPTPQAVRRYLGEFLSDRRVVELPPLLWQPILRGIILRTRPAKSARAYAEIWTPKGSPLAVHTRAIAETLQDRLGKGLIVDWAMRYGSPAIADRLAAMRAAGADRILVAPLYPQYCAATTASVMDAVSAALAGMRWQPAIRTLPPYYDDAAYISALARSARKQLDDLTFAPERLLASFHGMPARTLALGDPYFCHCVKTARLLGEALERPVEISFQSRFGRAKWLEPATDDVLRQLGREGVRSLAVITPGFAADCLETLEEIGLRGRSMFLAENGQNFALLRCINAETEAIDMYEALIARELGGWHDVIGAASRMERGQ